MKSTRAALLTSILACALAFGPVGCGGGEEPISVRPAPRKAAEPAPGGESKIAPGRKLPDKPHNFKTTTTTIKGLTMDLPQPWEPVKPSSNMRAFQAVIADGDAKADLVLFHFGVGGGGGVEANIERWFGQVEAAPSSEPFVEVLGINDVKVHVAETVGTMKPSPMMGINEAVPNIRLLGAVVEGEGGPWFIKITGDKDLVNRYREQHFALFRSFRVGG